MAIQILGLRSYTDAKGRERKAEKFFEKGWRAASVPELFRNINEIIGTIPESERWNLYYTAASCKETKGRILDNQEVIPIDLDGIDVDKVNTYIQIVGAELEIDLNKVGIVFSGNGLQFIIAVAQKITDVAYFDRERHLYKAMCGKINQAIYNSGLEGSADTSVFSAARLLRLPCTINRKPNKPEREAYVINGTIEPIDFDLAKNTGVPKVIEGQHIHPKAYSKLPDPDPIGVQDGCDFIKYCKENQANISEPQWYAMLSIIGRLPNGSSLCHEYSKGHPDYDYDNTEFKYNQALEASGPRTCENVDTLWDGCNKCPSYGKCKSPIMLRSESFIGTQDTGFYNYTVDKNGNEKRGKPNYDDLTKYFDQEHPYTTMESANIVHTFNGKRWNDISLNRIHNFAEVNFNPTPNKSMCTEFESKLKRTKLQHQDWFQVEGFINFNNGILDLGTMQMSPHSVDYGFKYVLPFDYDPDADCPRFEQFLKEITLDRQELIDILLEFMGYSLAGVDPAIGQKALILYGGGSNGKNILMDLLKELAGEGNYTTLSMGNEINNKESRYQLSGKLFNISEEVPTNAMADSSVFKALVSGGEVQARKLYCDSFSMRNYAKIIMACNKLPPTKDLTYGMLRRLIIIPFDARFTAKLGNKDPYILKKLLKESSGIFNLAMKGYKRFLEKAEFTDSKIVEKAVSNYVEENDTISNFIQDECAFQAEAESSSSVLYSNYKFYCEQGGLKPLNIVQFGGRLKLEMELKYGKDCTGRYMIDGRRVRGVKGITLVTGGQY